MADGSPSWLRKAWPAWLVGGVWLLMLAGSLLAQLPALQDQRASTFMVVWGTIFVIVFGVPLLVAWGVWSVLRVRTWPLRLCLYALFLLGDIALAGWAVYTFGHVQM